MSYTPGDIFYNPNSNIASGSVGAAICLAPPAAVQNSVRSDSNTKSQDPTFLYNNFHSRFHPISGVAGGGGTILVTNIVNSSTYSSRYFAPFF